MCLINKLNKISLIMIETAIAFSIGVIHLAFGFVIRYHKFTKFDIYNLFDSSPLFDFSIDTHCGYKQKAVVFHHWGGFSSKIVYNNEEDIFIYGDADIKWINGYCFCYTNISYKYLLYNGQIIPKGGQCPSEYEKNCGTIDTLEQELCIDKRDKCPLYDIGLGFQSDTTNYIYDHNSQIYYSKDNYNEANKKIIGRLILNEGQPCFYTLEKLWRKFSVNETDDNHLKCDLKIFDKYNDDRYEERGSITYKKIYEDNITPTYKPLILKYVEDNKEVSLYKREFLGINKECDEKFNLTKETYEIFSNNLINDSIVLIFDGAVVVFCTLAVFFRNITSIYDKEKLSVKFNSTFYSIYMTILIGFLIGQFFLCNKIIKQDLSDYNCSDDITNELIKVGSKDNLLRRIYVEINFFLDVFQFLSNILALLIGFILDRIDKCKRPTPEQLIDEKFNEDDDEHTDQNVINP